MKKVDTDIILFLEESLGSEGPGKATQLPS